jgi:hypothetical protein
MARSSFFLVQKEDLQVLTSLHAAVCKQEVVTKKDGNPTSVGDL